MGVYNPTIGETVTVWNETFQWTDKHFTPAQLLPLREAADDLGVATVARIQAIIAEKKQSGTLHACPVPGIPGGIDMFAVLEEHRQNDAVLQKFWEEAHAVPDWVDWAQIKRGQNFMWRYLLPNLTGLALQGFLGGTTMSSSIKT